MTIVPQKLFFCDPSFSVVVPGSTIIIAIKQENKRICQRYLQLL